MSIFRSAAKLTYNNAQDVIEGKPLGDIAVIPEHDASAIEHDIKALNDLAKELRTRRFQNGALALESPRLTFQLGADGLPMDCSQYTRFDAHELVEEVRSLIVGLATFP